MIKYVLCVLTIFVMSTSYYSQEGFTGTAVFGINTSQIDGDGLHGFTKLGWSGGVKIGYKVRRNSDLSIELLYNQKGSNAGFGFGDDGEGHVNLNYLEVPVVINLQDWYVEDEDYFKAKVHAGLSTGYLFSVKSKFTEFSGDVDQYNQVDLSYLLGASFYFSKHVGITMRYTRGINNLNTLVTPGGSAETISYFWTFRTEYKF